MEDTDFDSLCAGLSADDAKRLRKIFVEWCDGDENGFPVQMALLTRAQWQAAASIPRSLNDSRKWLELHLAEYRRQTAVLVKNFSTASDDKIAAFEEVIQRYVWLWKKSLPVPTVIWLKPKRLRGKSNLSWSAALPNQNKNWRKLEMTFRTNESDWKRHAETWTPA